MAAQQRQGNHQPAVKAENEKKLGITQRTAPINFSWTGEVRKRYTDFLVNEIAKDGKVIHLTEYEGTHVQVQQIQNGVSSTRPAPASQPIKAEPSTVPQVDKTPVVQPISDEDKIILDKLLGGPIAENLVSLDTKIQAKKQIPGSERAVVFEAVNDRTARANIHQEIRRIFGGRLETLANNVGVITATPAKWATSTRGKGIAGQVPGGRSTDRFPRKQGGHKNFNELGGEYLHFTLYKENKDTMDAINTIARLLKIKATNFGFAGTKDRRAGTVQRISVARQRASDMVWLNSRLPNVKIGDFKHLPDPLQLGQHGGNEFVITLKNCQILGDIGVGCSVQRRAKMIQEAVEFGLAYMKKHGYINYFGLQRFGTHTIGTHVLGMKVLKGDFEGVTDDILHVDDEFLNDMFEKVQPAHHHGNNDFNNSRDDALRARAITTWKTTRNANKALEALPKRFSAEASIIRHLGRDPKDFMGALLSVTRGMRMMYIHAYQSYVWNFVATRRWSKYGPTVIEGDLVLVQNETIDRTMANDDAEVLSDIEDDDSFYVQARALTKEDVSSGKYTIFDVVLPTPGYDIIYPRNDIGEYYADFMKKLENGELDPFDMRRKHREFSLSGNYRHLIGRFIGEPQYAVRIYTDDTEQMHPTDLDLCNHKKSLEKPAATPTTSASTSSGFASWNHFASNPAQYDKALTPERRRKASEEPASDDVTGIKETWVRTGIDGNAKRIKVARHHQQLESEVPRSDDSPVLPSPSLQAVPSTQSLSDIAALFSPPPTSAMDIDDTSVETKTGESSMSAATGFTGLPANDGSAPTTPSTLVGFARQEATDIDMSTELQAQPGQGNSETEYKPSAADPMGWYGPKMPDVSSVAGSAFSTEKKTGDSVAETNETKETKAASIIMPELFPPSPNPLVDVNNNAVTGGDDPNAKRVAVILKFQLKASNYATVVLRELTGAHPEDKSGLRAMSPA
ncbi:pseudouridine synthase [Bombardia bombarda]|uniref:Pseudouridine synthase n=1 Tax=Bombardia bombarda TaxID=252184 RepID=A0AA39WTC2_9PEZI|nr:pseudouridine synthase [Bombardia bombarda]